ncbi:MAG: hypothetical protein FWB96_02685 [Defluviitaleaceae bacterium]|nr:hypothetical protein [Defluviitaleaceae bacterium]MCL2264051.1 hypothetical protein [Defluviitaleaceae bacterium]
MKKLILLLFVLFAFVGCNENGAATEDENYPRIVPDVIISDRFFPQQVSEIYMNPSIYLGQIIQLQGLFITETWQGEYFHAVAQVVPSCCSPDGLMGFEILLDGKDPFEERAWVEFTGVLEEDADGILVLRALQIIEADEPA